MARYLLESIRWFCSALWRRSPVVPLLSGLLLVAAGNAGAQSSGPSNTDPYLPLPVTFEQQVGGILAAGYAAESQAREQLERLLEQVEAGQAARINMGQVEQVYLAVLKLDRAGHELQLWGEAAGPDFNARANQMRAEVKAVVDAMYAELKPRIDQRSGNAVRTAAAEAQKLAQVDRLLAREDYAGAMEMFLRISQPVEAQGVWWMATGGRTRHMVRFDTKLREFRARWQSAWLESARQVTSQAATKLRPDVAAFQRQMNEAATALSTLERVEFDGEQVSGPEAVRRASDRWLDYQKDLLWMRGVAKLNRIQGGEFDVPAVDQDINLLRDAALAGIERIMAADAQRATPAAAESLYFQYVQVLARLAALSANEEIEERLGPALEPLLARSPVLAAEVAAYREATSDLLRWRERLAEQQAAARQGEYPNLAAQLTAACRGNDELRGLLLERDRSLDEAKINGPLPPAVKSAAERILETRVSVSHQVNLGNGAALAVGPYDQRALAYLKASPREVAPAVESLLYDLFAEVEGVVPATLEAALAVETARQGDFVAAGGTVSRFGVIGWTGFFTSIPEGRRGMVRPDPLPEHRSRNAGDVVVRLIVDPDWVRHRHYFYSW